MDGRDFLKLAQRLASGNSEAEWRSAVSRGYYASFHVASSFVTSLGFTVPEGPQAHGFLSYGLQNCDIEKVEVIGNKFNSLKSLRINADYRLGRTINKKTSDKNVQRAERIISEIESIANNNSSLKQNIKNGMKKYYRNNGYIL